MDNIAPLDLESIPPPKAIPPVRRMTLKEIIPTTICFFDLETTSLKDNCEILQIAAITSAEGQEFNAYVIPDGDISPNASAVNGFTKRGNTIFLRGSPVTAIPLKEALVQFVKWLESFKSEICIVGHNIETFDVKHLFKAGKSNGIDFHHIVGFVDTLPLFRSEYPDEESYSQSNLFKRFINESYLAHDALEDVRALSKLVKCCKIDKKLWLCIVLLQATFMNTTTSFNKKRSI